MIERCLQNADELCQTGMLIDPMLTSKQAHRLLEMICYTEAETSKLFEMKQKAIIQGIFKVISVFIFIYILSTFICAFHRV